MSRLEKSAYHLLGDEMTPQKAVSLTYIGTELEKGPIYDLIEHEVQQYLAETKGELKGFSSTREDIEIEISQVRDLLKERRENFKTAIESAYKELNDSDRESLDEIQQSYLFSIRNDIVQDGEPIELLKD